MPFIRRTRRASVALLTAAVLLAGCHGSSKHASTTTGKATPTTAHGKVTLSLALRLGRLDVQAVGLPHPYTVPQRLVILRLVNHYIRNAITDPLVTGRRAAPLLASFTPALAAHIGPRRPDRAVLTDEGVPLLTSVTKTVKQPLNIAVLQQNGTNLMVGAQFAVTVQGKTRQGPLTVTRAGSFIFESDARHRWHITGYTIVVRRSLAGTTTTKRATTTTVAS